MSDESTVYVVDDDEAAANSVVALMASVGLKAESFNSAEEFLAERDRNRTGCLVLDIRLKGMSGLELQEALAAQGSEIPIIFISGHADRELSEKALNYGAVTCLEKPFNGIEFCETVRAVLAHRWSHPDRFDLGE